jgi:prevent-host-death family protein
MRMGLREANQHFSKAIKAVRAGHQVVLTERGKPIAIIMPWGDNARGDAAVRRMEAAGLLIPALVRRPMTPFRPRTIKGAPLSKTIYEARRSV